MSDRETVLRAIDEKRDEIIEFVRSLIRTGPVNPAYNRERDERECQEIIRSRLSRISKLRLDQFNVKLAEMEQYRDLPGFTTGFTENLPWEHRPNLLACLPGTDSAKGKSLLLAGHADVVAADNIENWAHHPFDAAIQDGILYGRGAVDMLSGLGCMVMAIEAIVESGIELKGDLWLGSAIGEESGGTGFLAIADYIKKNRINIDAGIMGEPTDLELSLLCRGVLFGELIVSGRTGHIEVTQPHWTEGGAVDAIRKGRYLMNAIDELNKEWQLRPEKNHPLLTETCEVKVAKIEAGHHLSSYADHCKISFNIQFLPHETDENGLGANTRKEFEDYIRKVAAADPWLSQNPPQVRWMLEADCSEVPASDPFVDVFRDAARAERPGIRTLGSGFHTDTGWLSRLGNIQMVNFGPGNPMQAHVTNEHCAVDDIITATKIIAAVSLDWCK